MAKILSLDCSVDACSVALLNGSESIAEFKHAPRAHGQLLLPMIERVLAQAALKTTRLDAIAFSKGPGSFTGLRIAASMVQALAYSADLPVIMISTLQTIAQSGFKNYQAEKVLVALDARMQEIYLGAYAIDEDKLMQPVFDDCLVKPEVLPPLTQKNFLVLGDAWQTYPQLKSTYHESIDDEGKDWHPNAEVMLVLAQNAYKRGKLLSPEQALPVYLRGQEAWGSEDRRQRTEDG